MIESHKDIIDYINSYISSMEYNEESNDYKEEVKVICSKYDSTEFWISRTYGIEGVLCINANEKKAIIISDNERAVRDLMRKLPVGIEFAFYFDNKYKDVLLEYIISDTYFEKENFLLGKKMLNTKQEKSNVGFNENIISSKKNPIVSEFKECNTLSGRIKNGLFVVEGALLVNRALSDNQLIKNVVYTTDKNNLTIKNILELCQQKNIEFFKTTSGIMASMTTTYPVPEIICNVKIKICGEEDIIFSDKRNIFLVLDGISNPDNLGIILRTADAAGIDGVILLSNCTHFLNKNAIRGGRGAVGKIPIYVVENDYKLFEILQREKFKIIGTSAKFKSSSFYDVDYHYKNIAIILGNESVGIRKDILNLCTEYVRIPMAEGQSSLNIAVASALMMYEYVRNNI